MILHLDTAVVILLYLVELIMAEKLNFAPFSLSYLPLKKVTFVGHIGGHLEFTHVEMLELILMNLVEFAHLKTYIFASNNIKLSALGQKL